MRKNAISMDRKFRDGKEYKIKSGHIPTNPAFSTE